MKTSVVKPKEFTQIKPTYGKMQSSSQRGNKSTSNI